MANIEHEDSSTDVGDSSTEVSEASEDDGTTNTGAAPDASPSLKRLANESQPSASTAAKLPKLLQTDEPKPPNKPVNALDFLKSRPQVAAMEQAQAQRATKPQAVVETKQTVAQTNTSKDPQLEAAASHGLTTDLTEPELPLFGSNNSASWQQHETILEFLRRLPVADPATARVGLWLWVRL